jgi:alpha-L-arabinofuranosidase
MQAPWFKNVNYFTWSPDLITFSADPAQTVLSTSYHVVKLFSSNVITKTLPAPSSAGFGPSYWVAGEGERHGSYIFKAAIYNSTMDVPVTLSFEGLKRSAKASLTVLTQKANAGVPNGLAQNVFGGPDMVQTTVKVVEANHDGVFAFSLPNLSVAVLATE